MNELLNNQKKSEILVKEIFKIKIWGYYFTYSEIARIDVKYPSNKYKSMIRSTRKMLMHKGIILENIVGDGYRLIQPDNFVDQSLKHYKRGFNEMQKGYDTLDVAPTEKMTQAGLVRYRRVHDRAVTIAASMKGLSVELKELSGKKQHPLTIENK